MTDLSTPNLKRLLAEATPGPWAYVPGEAVDERCIVNPDTTTPCIAIVENEKGSDCTDADLTLAALAPELAQEVLWMRARLSKIIAYLGTIDVHPQYTREEDLTDAAIYEVAKHILRRFDGAMSYIHPSGEAYTITVRKDPQHAKF